jgi:hypothetical protein
MGNRLRTPATRRRELLVRSILTLAVCVALALAFNGSTSSLHRIARSFGIAVVSSVCIGGLGYLSLPRIGPMCGKLRTPWNWTVFLLACVAVAIAGSSLRGSSAAEYTGTGKVGARAAGRTFAPARHLEIPFAFHQVLHLHVDAEPAAILSRAARVGAERAALHHHRALNPFHDLSEFSIPLHNSLSLCETCIPVQQQ